MANYALHKTSACEVEGSFGLGCFGLTSVGAGSAWIGLGCVGLGWAGLERVAADGGCD